MLTNERGECIQYLQGKAKQSALRIIIKEKGEEEITRVYLELTD
jgi:hypothetical protein